MFDLIKLRLKHGYQAIPDIRKARIAEPFRGFPILDESRCATDCRICSEICPTSAVSHNPLRLDLGRCIFCGECAHMCPSGSLAFTTTYRLGSTNRYHLIVESGMTASDYEKQAIESRKAIHRLFGRSLKFRQVSAGGCNGCEMELNASTNVNFDIGRFGVEFTASPRHADGLVITGPVSASMAPALRDAWESLSDPRLVVAVGACAISGGLFAESVEVDRTFFDKIKVYLYVPGCPTHPLTFIHAILDLIGRK